MKFHDDLHRDGLHRDGLHHDGLHRGGPQGWSRPLHKRTWGVCRSHAEVVLHMMMQGVGRRNLGEGHKRTEAGLQWALVLVV